MRWQTVLTALYPKHCMICQATITQYQGALCDACLYDAYRQWDYCTICGQNLVPLVGCINCETKRVQAIDHHIFGYRYQKTVRTAIIRLKFHRQTHMIRVVQELMAPVINEHQALLSTIDCIVPMPVDRARLASRGFNHALEIAESLQPLIQKPILHNVLQKRAFSIPQSDLSREERQRNVQGAFICQPIAGHVLLVDDVLTTGNTLNASSVVMKAAGAEKITALLLAKA